MESIYERKFTLPELAQAAMKALASLDVFEQRKQDYRKLVGEIVSNLGDCVEETEHPDGPSDEVAYGLAMIDGCLQESWFYKSDLDLERHQRGVDEMCKPLGI